MLSLVIAEDSLTQRLLTTILGAMGFTITAFASEETQSGADVFSAKAPGSSGEQIVCVLMEHFARDPSAYLPDPSDSPSAINLVGWTSAEHAAASALHSTDRALLKSLQFDGKTIEDLEVPRNALMGVRSLKFTLVEQLRHRKRSYAYADLGEILSDAAASGATFLDTIDVAIPSNSKRRQPKLKSVVLNHTALVNDLAERIKSVAKLRRRIDKALQISRFDFRSDDPSRIAAVYLVKDEEDIIFENLSWHFAQGIPNFVVFDNSSTDSTVAEIKRFQRYLEPQGGQLMLCLDNEIAYHQSKKTTAAANMARSLFGAEWVFAIDADEFISFPKNNAVHACLRAEKIFEERLGCSRSTPLFCASIKIPHHNYFCTPEDDLTERSATRRIKYRQGKPTGFKTCARWAGNLVFSQGNHKVINSVGSLVPAIHGSEIGVTMRHYPQRSPEHFVRKVRNGGAAYAASDLSKNSGHHWREWFEVLNSDGPQAVESIFHEKYVKPRGQLVRDPLPAVLLSRDGATIIPEAKNAPLELPLTTTPQMAIGGRYFAPDCVTLFPPNADHSVRLRFGTSDVATFYQIFSRGDYDIDIDADPTAIIDIGGNIGLAAVYFALRFPETTIVTVEPDHENFELLKENVAPYRNVHALNAAVWPRSGVLGIVRQDEEGRDLGSWGTRTIALEGGAPVIEKDSVRCVSIDEIVETFNFDRVSVMKIDIEGAELEVFSENYERWIPISDVILVETHDRFRPGSHSTVVSTMSGYDVTTTHSGENIVFKNNSMGSGRAS